MRAIILSSVLGAAALVGTLALPAEAKAQRLGAPRFNAYYGPAYYPAAPVYVAPRRAYCPPAVYPVYPVAPVYLAPAYRSYYYAPPVVVPTYTNYYYNAYPAPTVLYGGY